MQKPKDRPKESRSDKRVEQALEKLFPELNRIEPQLTRLLNEFDPATPRTTIEKGKKLLDSYLKMDSVRGRFFVRILKLMLKSEVCKAQAKAQLNELIKTAKTEAERDERYSLLLKLMHESDEQIPFASSIVVHRHADPEKSFLKQMDPLPDLEAARNSAGERRFRHVIEGLRRTVEHLYEPYVKTLVYLSFIRDKKPEDDFKNIDSMTLGVALEHVAARLADYPDLFDSRAPWFRNAITHEIPDYDRATDTLILNDRSKSARITTDELLEMAESLYQMSAKTVAFVSQLYLFRELFRDTGFFDLCVEYLPRMAVETEVAKIESIEKEFREEIEAIFRQYRR